MKIHIIHIYSRILIQTDTLKQFRHPRKLLYTETREPSTKRNEAKADNQPNVSITLKDINKIFHQRFYRVTDKKIITNLGMK